jgi:DNA-directed RNA polymerase specialized sigma24 family protein
MGDQFLFHIRLRSVLPQHLQNEQRLSRQAVSVRWRRFQPARLGKTQDGGGAPSRTRDCSDLCDGKRSPCTGNTIFFARSLVGVPIGKTRYRAARHFVLEEKIEICHARRVESVVPARTGTERPQFATTRWTLILRQQVTNAECPARDALAQLCQIYWRPIFTYICRRGYSVSDAQDLTQDFFMMILQGKLFSSAHPERGRFRYFLLKSLKNFLIDTKIKQLRYRRGGEFAFVSWEEWMAEAPSQLFISARALESCPAETLFDLRWAASVAEQALRRLREECESQGHRRAYETLGEYLTADRAEISYRNLAEILGASTAIVKRLMHEFRARYRTLLKEEIARTVEDGADVDDEIRYLCAALSSLADR